MKAVNNKNFTIASRFNTKPGIPCLYHCTYTSYSSSYTLELRAGAEQNCSCTIFASLAGISCVFQKLVRSVPLDDPCAIQKWYLGLCFGLRDVQWGYYERLWQYTHKALRNPRSHPAHHLLVAAVFVSAEFLPSAVL